MRKGNTMLVIFSCLVFGTVLTGCSVSNTNEGETPSEIEVSNSITHDQFESRVYEFNEIYKKALFSTGQNKVEEAAQSVPMALEKWNEIEKVASDNTLTDYFINEGWEAKLIQIGDHVRTSNDLMGDSKLSLAHEELEQVRLLFRDLREENNIKSISDEMLYVHDHMEEIVETKNL